ncbi:hypothetical protein D3C71_2095950 [compost metagenome]
MFAWFTAAEMADLDIRPAFLRDFLGNLQAQSGVLHIVHRDEALPPGTSGAEASAHRA